MIYWILGAVWWVVASCIINAIPWRNPKEEITFAVFWPVFAPPMLVILLWRMPFRAARGVRSDLRTRKKFKEFERWLRERADHP